MIQIQYFRRKTQNLFYLYIFIKDYPQFTNNRRRCPTYGYLVSLIFLRLIHELLCVVWKFVCERQETCADL